MNTLNKNITATFFKTENGYNDLIAHWSALMNDKEACKKIKAEHHLLYLILRGKDWRKGFTPATNSTKLVNGYKPDHAIKQAMSYIYSNWYKDKLFAPFAELTTPEAQKLIQDLLPEFIDRGDTHPLNGDAYKTEVPENAIG